MQKIILTQGVPASGKSTWAKELVAKEPETWARVCRDDLRHMLNNYTHTMENERLVHKVRNNVIADVLRSGRNVIIDETNIEAKSFNDVVKMVRKLNIECEVLTKPFYLPLEEAVARDALREGKLKVEREVIEKFWKKSGKEQFRFTVAKSEYVEKLNRISKLVEQNKELPKAIICDLDGTLAQFSKIGEKQINNWHVRCPYDASTCEQDTVNQSVAMVIRLFRNAGYRIIFCSGRKEMYKASTLKFLDKAFPEMVNNEYDFKFTENEAPWFDLFMREDGDNRKDSIIKEEIYRREIEGKYNVLFSLDDRNQIIDLHRQVLGIPCFQVAYGDF